MGKVAKKLTDLIGKTPSLELSGYSGSKGLQKPICAKLEYFNPLGSVKDRVALYMINDAERRGLVGANTLIVEPTSGNTGIGLAGVCAARGYRLVLTMPDNMSLERRKLLAALGAELVLTPAAEGMAGAVKRAEELALENPDSFIPSQFENPVNAQAHRETTALELLEDMGGDIDIFVACVGTGGTITGCGEVLKARISGCMVVAVEPAESPLLSGGTPGPHKIQGIGANFIPAVLNRGIYDEVFTVSSKQAMETCRELAKTEGLLVGISSGAACYAAKELALRYPGKSVVAVFPDTGERYMSMDLYTTYE